MKEHKQCYSLCPRCVWRYNGGCSEWRGIYMDIEKLIEQLRNEAATFRPNSFAQTMLLDAATALSTLQIENQALRNAANGFKAENAQLRHRLIEAISACSRIAEWAQNTGHDYVEGIAREFLEEDE